MSPVENMMLSVCFGYVIGDLLGFLFIMIMSAWEDHKEKKRSKENQAEA